MLTREEIEIILEREGIAEFFPVIDAVYLKEHDLTIYELNTDYFGLVFRIFPPAYAGPDTQQIIANTVASGLPPRSHVDIIQFTSKDLEYQKKRYDAMLSKDIDDSEIIGLEHPEYLKLLHQSNIDFLNKHVEETVFKETKLPFYLRDYINLIAIQIPMKDSNGQMLSQEKLIPLVNKFLGSVEAMSPMNVDEDSYIHIMNEMLMPHRKNRRVRRDPTLDINQHFVDYDTLIEDIGNGVLRFSNGKQTDIETQERVEVKRPNLLNKIYRWVKYNLFKHEEEVEAPKKPNQNGSNAMYAKVLSRKKYPRQTTISETCDLSMDYFNTNRNQQIPLPHMITMSIKIEDPKEIADEINMKARWNKLQLDSVGKIKDYFKDLQDRQAESDEALHIINNGEIAFKASWTMILYADNIYDLEYISSAVIRQYQNRQFELQEESLILFMSFFYAAPLKFDEMYMRFSERYKTIWRSNVAAVAPIGCDSRGFGTDPVILYYGRNGQPEFFDFFYHGASNRNAIMVAPSGKGKSFSMSRIVWSYLRTQSKIRIIDSGYSYKPLCDLLGGQYIDFNDDICMNPFTYARRDEDGALHVDEIANIVAQIGVMAGIDLSSVSESILDSDHKSLIAAYLADAVRMAWRMHDPGESGMADVDQALRQMYKNLKEDADLDGAIRDNDIDTRIQTLIVQLKEFTHPQGIYYHYVNGRATINFNSNLVILEMDSLMEKEKRFKDFVITAFSNQVEREFYQERKNKIRKFLIIDEAWQLLDGNAGQVIAGLYRRARKLMGSIITISQSINDYYSNASIQAIYENAYWRLFLEQDSNTIEKAVEDKRLVLHKFDFDLLNTLRFVEGMYSEIMILTQPGDLIVGRILVTPVEYWISTQDQGALIDGYMREYGIDEETARICKGASVANDNPFELEVLKHKGIYEEALEDVIEACA